MISILMHFLPPSPSPTPLYLSLSLSLLCQLDLPELPALGSVDASEGPLRDAQNLAAAAFGAKRTWFLTNGSSGGLHAAILAAVQVCEHRRRQQPSSTPSTSSSPSTSSAPSSSSSLPAPVVLIPRNAHRSVLHGILLAGLSLENVTVQTPINDAKGINIH